MKHTFSRRDFLKAMLTSLGVILTSCLPRTEPTPPATFSPTVTNTSELTPTSTPTATSTPEPTPTSTETQTPTPTPIPCFRLLTPENGSQLLASGKVTFAWEAMPGAVNYRLEIILPTGQSVFFETPTTSREQYLETYRLGGEYHWQVTAFDAGGIGICTAGAFTFEKPEHIPPAQNEGGNNSGGSTSGNVNPTEDPCIDNPTLPQCGASGVGSPGG